MEDTEEQVVKSGKQRFIERMKAKKPDLNYDDEEEGFVWFNQRRL